MTNLSREEIICLYSLVETSKMGLLPKNYYFGDYAEWYICLNKTSTGWQVYRCERGNKFDIETFDDCKKACFKVIWECSYNKEEVEQAIEYFLMEVTKGYLLFDSQINEFKKKYLNDEHINEEKKSGDKNGVRYKKRQRISNGI